MSLLSIFHRKKTASTAPADATPPEDVFQTDDDSNIIWQRFKDFVTDWFIKKLTIKRDVNFLETTASLLNEPTYENINKAKILIHLHRHYENTKARRRLEKWSSRVIAIYLSIVATLLVVNYMKIETKLISIPNNIIVAILTTTTINIIGLVLIVLRGYFLSKEDEVQDTAFQQGRDIEEVPEEEEKTEEEKEIPEA